MNANTGSRILMHLTSELVKARYDALRSMLPDLNIVTTLAPGIHRDIRVAYTHRLPPDAVAQLPNLNLVASVATGVDAILATPGLPTHVRVTRSVEPGIAQSMAQFVIMQLLRQFRHQSQLEAQHFSGSWSRIPVPDARKVTVGVMGLGNTGAKLATLLLGLGFKVVGWARSAGKDRPVETFLGEAALKDFLNASNYLVCLLPLTPQTTNLLDRRRMRMLPQGAYVINVARGGILIEDDLLELVHEEHLAGAALDVFATEPLATTSLLWKHKKIFVTPHVAAQPSMPAVIEQFAENLKRLESGEPLLNEVDRIQGY